MKEINIMDILGVNIEYNEAHLRELFSDLKKSNFINSSSCKDEYIKLKENIQLFENTSKTFKSLLKLNRVEELNEYYQNSYLKDYKNVIELLTALQQKKLYSV